MKRQRFSLSVDALFTNDRWVSVKSVTVCVGDIN